MGSNLHLGYFTPRSTQPSIPPESVNEYQLWLGRQGQVWLIPIADECVGVKLWNPLRTCAIPERFCDGDSLLRGAISSVCTFTFTDSVMLNAILVCSEDEHCAMWRDCTEHSGIPSDSTHHNKHHIKVGDHSPVCDQCMLMLCLRRQQGGVGTVGGNAWKHCSPACSFCSQAFPGLKQRFLPWNVSFQIGKIVLTLDNAENRLFQTVLV